MNKKELGYSWLNKAKNLPLKKSNNFIFLHNSFSQNTRENFLGYFFGIKNPTFLRKFDNQNYLNGLKNLPALICHRITTIITKKIAIAVTR